MGVPIEQLRDGKLAIYELMAEESAVNYWEVRLSSSSSIVACIAGDRVSQLLIRNDDRNTAI